MKSALIATLLLACVAAAEDEPLDPGLLLTKLEVAVNAKDMLQIGSLAATIGEFAKTSENQAELDPLAALLVKSLKVCNGNWGTQGKIVDALGELRSKKGLGALKRIAFKKKSREGDEEELQARALLAVGKMRDTRQLKGLEEMCKNRSRRVAKAAYEAFRYFGPCKGRVRRNVAEVLMKRIDMEYPASGGQGGKSVSAEKQERWQELQGTIIGSLQVVCRQSTINDIDNWREWWRENKKNRRAWKDPKS